MFFFGINRAALRNQGIIDLDLPQYNQIAILHLRWHFSDSISSTLAQR